MKIFVTGGTGFIGSHFIAQALESGHEVVALRRRGSQPRVPLKREPIWQDIPMSELQTEHFRGIDAVVHLAAHTANVPYDTLENCLHWNATIPLAMGTRALAGGVKRFVIAGSCFEYGRSGERYAFIPPDAPLEPTQSYPISKAAASVAWLGFAREQAAALSILRVFQVYGPGEPEGRLWPSIRAAAISGADYAMTLGEQVRDFIPVAEVAQAFLSELTARPTNGCPCVKNVGTGQPLSVADFAQRIWRAESARGELKLGALPYRKNEVMRFVPDVSATHTFL